MYISDLEIKGFKSFADTTKLKFAQGLTCIVGPNGCGKTNVVDAIRWVMGEQKSSVLRSTNMQEVIFSGTSRRKPVNYAEVALTIHNDRGILPVEYTEVVVSRRVFRDGTSEYYLNKTPCRLKDITDLFVDTGMGADAYSVIELKMVESILSESKEERRRLIEEASGINKYKQQRRLSMRRLDATEVDLSRVSDIILEVDKNVRSLKRQLARYKRYDRVRQQLQDDDIALASLQVGTILKELNPLEQRVLEIRQGYGLTGEQVGLEEQRVEEAKDELAAAEAQLKTQQELVTAKRGEQVAIEQTLMLAEEKIANASAALDRLRVETATLDERETSARALQEDLQNELEHLYPQLETVRREYTTRQDVLKAATEAYRSIKTDFDARSQKQRELLNAGSDLEHQRSRLEAALEQYGREIKGLKEKRQRLDKTGAGYQMDLDLITTDFSQAETLYHELADSAEHHEKSLQELQEKLGEVRETLARKRGERVSVENQLSFYEELLETGEGYSSGVRAILEADEDLPGVLGTVADLFEVEEAYEQAIQAALGPLAEAVVTTDRASALKAIAFLEKTESGNAAFLPLEGLRKVKATAVTKGAGIIKAAVDAVSSADQFDSLRKLLLQDVTLVEDDFKPEWRTLTGRYVTRNGTVYDGLGLIRGGQGSAEAETIMGRKDRRERLRKAFVNLSSEIEQLSSDLETLHEEIGRSEKALRNARSARENQRQILLEFERKSSRAQYGIHSTSADLEALEGEQTSLEQTVTKTRAQIDEMAPRLEELESQRTALETELNEMESAVQQALTARDEANEAAQSSRLEVVNRENDERNLKTRLQSVAEGLEDINQRRQTLGSEHAEQEASLERNRGIQEEEKERLAGIKSEVTRESEILEELENRTTLKRKTLNDLEYRLRDHLHQREAAAQQLQELTVQVTNLQARREHLLERIQEKYQRELPKDLNVDDDRETLEKRIKRSERFIENLGPINMAVQDEYEAEQSRLTFLKEQETDLVEARTSLLETVSKLDRIARKQFRETFAQIQEHFRLTFEMLFDGGQASLDLDNPDDVLESDVVIKATPKGKKTQNLKMLSAGEKALTAIALLFAIYQVKPSPYCVLDEVDAPLDDRNIRKYTKMLEHFTTHTQFIVITHNKLTMEAAKYLYGVTMEEEGVSKLVSVQLT